MSAPSEVAGAQPAAAPASNGAAPAPWYAGAPDELRGIAELKGWDKPEKALESYRNLEKFHGVGPERLLRLPEKEDSPDWGGVFDRLGRPKEAAGYEIEGADPELLAVLHKEGLSKKQAKNLAAAIVARADASKQATQQASDAELQVEEAELKREWGGEYATNLRNAQAVAEKVFQHVGFASKEEMNTFLDSMQKTAGKGGYTKVMKLFAYFGRNLGEGQFVEGQNGAASAGQPFGMTPAAAKAKFDAMQADPDWQKRFNSDQKAVREGALAERHAVARIAFGE